MWKGFEESWLRDHNIISGSDVAGAEERIMGNEEN